MKMGIGQILFSNYIKYNKLMEVTQQAFAGSNSNNVNIYLDMYDMVSNIYRKDYEIEDQSIIASSIINLCAHLRAYYLSRHRVETKIFIVYSTNTNSLQERLCPGYNCRMIERMNDGRLNKLILYNINLLKTLCPYLDKIYMVSGSDFEPSVVIYDLILKEAAINITTPNIVITRSPYAYQIPAMNNNTVIFRPKKYNGEDVSYLINNKNCIIRFIIDTRRMSIDEKRLAIINRINPEFLGIIMGMTNLSCRSIKSLFEINTVLNYLDKAISDHLILNNYNTDIDSVINILAGYNPRILSYGFTLSSRCKAIDLVYQHRIYYQTVFASDNSYLIDLIDDNSVRAINNEYFKKYPLDLNRL